MDRCVQELMRLLLMYLAWGYQMTSERQELLLRMMLATTPDMPLSLRSGRDEQGCLGARDMLGCASQLPACHVFTTRDFQRLSAVYLSKISQLPVCHILLSNFKNMTSFHRHYIMHNCPLHHSKPIMVEPRFTFPPKSWLA